MKLHSLPIGKTAVITSITCDGRRLRRLGLSEGATVSAVLSDADGELRAYSCKGVLIALRRGDGEKIICQRTAD